MTQAFESHMQQYLQRIEHYLSTQCLRYPGEPQQKLMDSMRYSLLAGGKRLRPVMVLEFCRMCGGEDESALPLAAAIEMIHTYSLIHDDLPCMDNDDFRRGNPTNHRVYGEAIAVLAGDSLLTEAFTMVSKAPLPAEARVLAIQTLAECSGCTGMVGGQVLDIMSEERACTEQEILDIQVRKTGALIRAACMMGVIAGTGNQEQMDAAARFADHLGLAFQIRDDMLDVIGSAEKMGKSVGTDQSKNTFVRLYGLQRCERLVQEHTRAALDALSAFNDPSFLTELAHRLTSREN